MKQVLGIKTDGSVWLVGLDGDELARLQVMVGGWVQCVDLENRVDLWCNEEGKMIGLPVNPLATMIWQVAYGPTDVMVGDVVISGGADNEGNMRSVHLPALYDLLSRTQEGRAVALYLQAQLMQTSEV